MPIPDTLNDREHRKFRQTSTGDTAVSVVVTDDEARVFQTNDIDDYTTSNVTYIGKEKSDGTWWIVKIDETGDYAVKGHATVTNNPTLTTYTLAWTDRVTATYSDYSVAF